MVYGTYSRGYRAGDINVSGVTSLPSGYQLEFTDNFEIGVKGSAADGRVRANLTGFLIKTKDQQGELLTTSRPSPARSSTAAAPGRSRGLASQREATSFPAAA